MSPTGYARILTAEDIQVFDRQFNALHAADCEFEDHASSAKVEWPSLAAYLDHLRKGDVQVVLFMD